jgi:hypothetical protein
MTPAEWSINKKIIEDAQKFLTERRALSDGSEQTMHGE